MCKVIDIIGAFAIGYLVGSFPTGYLVVKWKTGMDVRQTGSSSTGATNVSRVLGKKVAVIVALVDALKGVAAFFAVRFLLGGNGVPEYAAVGAVVGHCFPVWLRFRGGKGVSTAFGTTLVIATVPALFAFGFFLFTLAVARRVSAASLTAVWIFAGTVFLFDMSLSVKLLALFLAAFITFTHRENIKRLFAGEEKPIFGVK